MVFLDLAKVQVVVLLLPIDLELSSGPMDALQKLNAALNMDTVIQEQVGKEEIHSETAMEQVMECLFL